MLHGIVYRRKKVKKYYSFTRWQFYLLTNKVYIEHDKKKLQIYIFVVESKEKETSTNKICLHYITDRHVHVILKSVWNYTSVQWKRKEKAHQENFKKKTLKLRPILVCGV